MHIIQVNVVDAEPLQALVGAFQDIFRGRVCDHAGILHLEAKLGREEDVGAALRVEPEPLAHDVFAVAIDVGSVPVCTAELPRAIENLEALLVGPGLKLALM